VVVHSPWLARANELAPLRLDSHTRVQIVLACEPHLDIGDQIFLSQPLGLNPPSRGLGTEIPKALPMDQRWEHLFFIKFSVECNVHELATCLASLGDEIILCE
jgi:hypothetical protein